MASTENSKPDGQEENVGYDVIERMKFGKVIHCPKCGWFMIRKFLKIKERKADNPENISAIVIDSCTNCGHYNKRKVSISEAEVIRKGDVPIRDNMRDTNSNPLLKDFYKYYSTLFNDPLMKLEQIQLRSEFFSSKDSSTEREGEKHHIAGVNIRGACQHCGSRSLLLDFDSEDCYYDSKEDVIAATCAECGEKVTLGPVDKDYPDKEWEYIHTEEPVKEEDETPVNKDESYIPIRSMFRVTYSISFFRGVRCKIPDFHYSDLEYVTYRVSKDTAPYKEGDMPRISLDSKVLEDIVIDKNHSFTINKTEAHLCDPFEFMYKRGINPLRSYLFFNTEEEKFENTPKDVAWIPFRLVDIKDWIIHKGGTFRLFTTYMDIKASIRDIEWNEWFTEAYGMIIPTRSTVDEEVPDYCLEVLYTYPCFRALRFRSVDEFQKWKSLSDSYRKEDDKFPAIMEKLFNSSEETFDTKPITLTLTLDEKTKKGENSWE